MSDTFPIRLHHQHMPPSTPLHSTDYSYRLRFNLEEICHGSDTYVCMCSVCSPRAPQWGLPCLHWQNYKSPARTGQGYLSSAPVLLLGSGRVCVICYHTNSALNEKAGLKQTGEIEEAKIGQQHKWDKRIKDREISEDRQVEDISSFTSWLGLGKSSG